MGFDTLSYLIGKQTGIADAFDAVTTSVSEPVGVASFDDGADNVPVNSLVVNVTPVQSGSGDPSPDNVRPISGWTGANISVNGVNQYDGTLESGDINAQGENVPSTLYSRSPSYIPVKENTEYCRSAGAQIVFYDINKAFLSRTPSIVGGSFTTPSGCAFIRFVVAVATTQIGINYPATETSYVPYFGKTYTVSWQSEAGTVYGGTLTDNGNGTWSLTVTHKGITLTSADQLQGFTTSAQYGAFASIVGTNDIKHADSATIYGLCSCAEFISYNNRVAQSYIEKFRCWADTNNGVLIVRASVSSNIQTKDDLYAEYANGQFVYELATPQTYTLSAESVRTLLGDNNIFCDCGSIDTLTYRADPTIVYNRIKGGV
jgi:hypothetical protein